MKVFEVLRDFREGVPHGLLVDESGQPWGHQQMVSRIYSQKFSDEEATVAQFADGEGWRLGSKGVFRPIVPQVLRVSDKPRKNTLTTAKLIVVADPRLGLVHHMDEWMLWFPNPDGGHPVLLTVEYWINTRAEIFRRYAAAVDQVQQSRAAAQEEREEPEGEEDEGPDEIAPIYLTERLCQVPEWETVH